MDKNINNNGFEFVDLGLPSRTLWATCNVGADKPTDYGQYFQWGDTIGYMANEIETGDGQKKFTWNDYKWNPSGDGRTFTKYTHTGEMVELEDDAANVNMGGDWHMPSSDQIRELIDNTIVTWIALDNGTSGMKFTSKKDDSRSIFIPAAGYAWDGSVDDNGEYGLIWSCALSTSHINNGQYIYLISKDASLYDKQGRGYGFPVRGVIGYFSSCLNMC